MSQEDLEGELRALRGELAEMRARRQHDSGTPLLAATAAAGRDAAPEAHQQLLGLIVRTAALALDAEAASLFVIDEKAENFVFQVAIGGAGDMLVGQRIPLGTGIVGLVAATGTAMTVNSARDDPRFATSFGKGTGHVPENLLANPTRALSRPLKNPREPAHGSVMRT